MCELTLELADLASAGRATLFALAQMLSFCWTFTGELDVKLRPQTLCGKNQFTPGLTNVADLELIEE